jgi:hypothetical protein
MKQAEAAFFKTKTVGPGTFDFNGLWINELFSQMELRVSGSDVTGVYTSAVSEHGGRTVPFPLKGTVCGDLISFTVNWEEAITTWTGHGTIANGKRRILTLWHLIQTVPDETDPQQQWRTVLSGADEFDPVG